MVALVFAMLLAAVLIWLVGAAFGSLPGDEIPFSAALGQVTLYGLLMLASGSVAFAAAPTLGRTRALGLGLIALFAPYLIASYASLSPIIDALTPLSWYTWTAGRRPMAGVTDWVSLLPLALLTVAFLGVGVMTFVRRDLGRTAVIAWLRLPSLPAGIRGPFTRQLADRTAIAIAWGVGTGLYGVLIVVSAQAFSDSLRLDPRDRRHHRTDLSGDRHPPGLGRPATRLLQLRVVHRRIGRGVVPRLVGGRRGRWSASRRDGGPADPGALDAPVRSGRLRRDRGPHGRARGDHRRGGPHPGHGRADPDRRIAILGLAAAAFAGIGLAAGGLVRSTLAAPVAALVVIATFLLDTLGPALDLPDPVLQLSLFKHLGQPMAGILDPVGIVAALVLAVGGLTLGAWGLQRRDLER